ncbi:MAG TPA: cell division protein ZipA C-terminal FtsZ-binding domain-containing protein [Casimicrobiaceae bacterium]|nr:cell division protein ZipA C-terminal FtsZ-binding domain-containing protein [Casimicrobiaceae bacterium]
MSRLQIALIVAGVVLVVGVLLYNAWQMRRARRKLAPPVTAPRAAAESGGARIEPTLRTEAPSAPSTPVTPSAPRAGTSVVHDPDFRPPMDDVVGLEEGSGTEAALESGGGLDDEVAAGDEATMAPRPRAAIAGMTTIAAPDPDIETILTLQPVRPLSASMLAPGLHARLGKPVRWYGRREPRGAWQRLGPETRGDYVEFAACMLLADRNGPATHGQIDAFRKVVGEVAATLPAAFDGPGAADEAQRAEALDKLCADLDMQIGLTVRKAPPATIAGTRLRGVAEASGFRLAPTGRFEWVQDETGAVLFTLQNITDEAFTAESLRQGSTPGVVFLLDVPRVVDPGRAFDQMKIAAKRMAHTVGGELVDDNGRPLNDSGLAAIREQVMAADDALRRTNIEPGSPRALKLFAA